MESRPVGQGGDVQADNPGWWMIHCHNAFHLEAGMATSLAYVQ